MKIVIGTENTAKVEAVKKVISKLYEGANFISIKSESNVSGQPLSDEEAIEGAINRAKFAFSQHGDSDLSIGMEGYVEDNRFGMFLGGWVAIIDKTGKLGLGSSGRVKLPDSIRKNINAGNELGPLIEELLGSEKYSIRNNQGTNGILTKGLYGRVKEFEDATSCALAVFMNPKLY
jgi:inosine/xanthosine triphosphatase